MCEVKINFLRTRKILLDLSLQMGVIVLPQPIYYIVVEFIKCFGALGRSLYYPNPWAILGQILLIIVLYMPFYI